MRDGGRDRKKNQSLRAMVLPRGSNSRSQAGQHLRSIEYTNAHRAFDS